MKNFIIITAILFTLSSNAQKILAQQRGVSLSYQSQFYNTLVCGEQKFNQYLITVYLENNSGHSITIDGGSVDHTDYVNNTNVSPCRHSNAGADFASKYDWPNSSSERKSYYILVPAGDGVPQPTNWLLGSFRFMN